MNDAFTTLIDYCNKCFLEAIVYCEKQDRENCRKVLFEGMNSLVIIVNVASSNSNKPFYESKARELLQIAKAVREQGFTPVVQKALNKDRAKVAFMRQSIFEFEKEQKKFEEADVGASKQKEDGNEPQNNNLVFDNNSVEKTATQIQNENLMKIKKEIEELSKNTQEESNQDYSEIDMFEELDCMTSKSQQNDFEDDIDNSQQVFNAFEECNFAVDDDVQKQDAFTDEMFQDNTENFANPDENILNNEESCDKIELSEENNFNE